MEEPASPPRIAGPPDLSNDLLTEAVTTAVLHRQQVEDAAAASSSSGQEKKLQAPVTKQDPRRAGCWGSLLGATLWEPEPGRGRVLSNQ